MKKVLASILAGSMVLGMASMANAALLKKDESTGDYDFRIWAYEPKGTYTKYEDWEDLVKAKIVPNAVVKALNAYETAYKAIDVESGDVEYADVQAALTAYKDLAAKIVAADLVSGSDKTEFEAADEITVAELVEDIEANAKGDVTVGSSSTVGSIAGVAKYAPAFAPNLIPSPAQIRNILLATNGGVVGGGAFVVNNKDSYKLVDNAGNDFNLYNYGDGCDEVTIRLSVANKEDLRIDVASGKVTMSRKRVATNQAGADIYDIKIKAAAGVRDFELDDFKIEFDCHDSNIVFFVEGKVAYSDYRDVEPDERYINTKCDYDDDHEDGCVYNFDQVIDEETRIICNDYVDVLFKGNYGTDFENMRVLDDDIAEVEDFFQDYDIDYYDFIGLPKFAKDVTVRVDADSDSYIYEFDKKTGDVVDITDECTYTSDGWTFKRKTLKTYVVLEEPYEGGNVRADKEPVDDEPTEPDDTDAAGSKPNPGTGAMPF